MRHAALAVALAAPIVLAAPAASAAPQATAVVRPGVGIGPVKLGMTTEQVRKALGAPAYARGTRTGFGRLLIEYSYWPDGYTVFLLRERGRARVVSVETTLPSQKTPRGLGVGSTERQLRRVYPPLRCRAVFPKGGGIITSYDCVARSRNGSQTVFSFSREPEYDPNTGREGPVAAPQHVDWVTVREPV
jgi:hypothetical protein